MSSADVASSDRPQPPVGIDLGTTLSVVAYVDPTGRPITVPNRSGDLLTPSAVAFEEDVVIVGHEAIKGSVLAPEAFADCFKRDMGRAAYHRAGRRPERSARGAQRLPPQTAQGGRRAAARAHPAGRHHRAGLLRRGTPQGHAGRRPSGGPGGAGHHQRADRRRRHLRLSPRRARRGRRPGRQGRTPAGLRPGRRHVRRHHPRDRRHHVPHRRDRRRRAAGRPRFRRTAGRPTWPRSSSPRTASIPEATRATPRNSGSTPRTPSTPCPSAARPRSSATITASGCGRRSPASASRSSRRTSWAAPRATTSLVLRQAGLQWDQIDRILLVGGSTRMPMVAEMLRRLSGKEPDRSLSPDEAVAHGAALYAAMLMGESGAAARAKVDLINVNSHSLGVVGVHTQTGERRNVTLIPKNTPLPARKVRQFQTARANQPTRQGAGRRRREPPARALHRPGRVRHPRPAAGLAQGDADRGDLRIRRQRPALGDRPRALGPPIGPRRDRAEADGHAARPGGVAPAALPDGDGGRAARRGRHAAGGRRSGDAA